MKQIEYSTVYKGNDVSGIIMLPETVKEALATMGEEKVYQHFKYAYMNAMKIAMKMKRQPRERKFIKIELDRLSDEQREALEKAGLI